MHAFDTICHVDLFFFGGSITMPIPLFPSHVSYIRFISILCTPLAPPPLLLALNEMN
jgi:hypothetical protein